MYVSQARERFLRIRIETYTCPCGVLYSGAMPKNTNPITPELEALALSVVASLDGPPAGFVPATPGQVAVGQVVSCWGHNKQRVGVVTEVTKTRVHVLFTTPGAIDEAQRITAHVQARPINLESYIAEARPNYTSNYLFTLGEARLETAKYGKKFDGSVDTEHLVGYANRLAEYEDEGFEAGLTAQAEAALADVLRRKGISWQDRVGFTHSWKKISDCYVEEVVAS
jgi:hypothetical protein